VEGGASRSRLCAQALRFDGFRGCVQPGSVVFSGERQPSRS
jgi:hypothetical protein